MFPNKSLPYLYIALLCVYILLKNLVRSHKHTRIQRVTIRGPLTCAGDFPRMQGASFGSFYFCHQPTKPHSAPQSVTYKEDFYVHEKNFDCHKLCETA